MRSIKNLDFNIFVEIFSAFLSKVKTEVRIFLTITLLFDVHSLKNPLKLLVNIVKLPVMKIAYNRRSIPDQFVL